MAFLLNPSDFAGRYMRPQDQHSIPITQSYIATEEKTLICWIFGATLGTAINTYIDNNRAPINAELDALINPLIYDDGCKVIESKGLKVILLGLIWYTINTNSNKHAAQNGGQAMSKMEMSQQMTTNPGNYIESVASIRAVQHYCRKNSAVYPTFNGQHFETTGLL